MDFQISLNDFSILCRFCLLRSTELKCIYEVPSTEIYTTLTEIQFNCELPDKICVSCEEIFEKFSIFIEKSKQHNDLLKAVLKNSLLKGDCDNFYLMTNFCDVNDSEEDNDIKNKSIHDEEYILSKNSKLGGKQKVLEGRVKKKSLVVNTCEQVQKKTLKSFKECEQCMKSFSSQSQLRQHYKSSIGCVPKQLKFSCRQCGKEFIGRAQLRVHYKEFQECAPESIKLFCDTCKLYFLTKTKLYEHYKESPGCLPQDFNCSLCNKGFNKKHKLITHMRSHTKEEPFECQECGKKFRFQQNLRRHYLIHKGVKPFKCEVCGKAFSRSHVKNEHMNIHTGHNPYICMYCGKGFKRYANHFIHVYRHKLINGEVDKSEDKKLYLQLECNICNKIFASRGSLTNHLTLHQEKPREKAFLCNVCGRGFVTKAQLQSHARTHTGDRPYECTHCGKKFRQKSAFSIHQNVHSGEKPYQCKICEKLFTQSGHLRVHMRVHSGEKPYACSFCGKNFALKSNLKVHTRIHTGETPYICSVCGHGYYESTSLKKHTKSHGVGLPSHGYVNDFTVEENETKSLNSTEELIK